jgi:hypothetical protein
MSKGPEFLNSLGSSEASVTATIVRRFLRNSRISSERNPWPTECRVDCMIDTVYLRSQSGKSQQGLIRASTFLWGAPEWCMCVENGALGAPSAYSRSESWSSVDRLGVLAYEGS